MFAALFSEARRERAALRDAQNRSEGELDAARAIQLGMLPDRAALAKLDPRIDIAAQLEAAKSVGGDFYDIIRLDADRIVILIADVTGKGVPAALFMALSKALTTSVMLRSPGGLADTAALLNDELMRDSGDALGLTMLLCLIDLRDRAGGDGQRRARQPACASRTDGAVIEEAAGGRPAVLHHGLSLARRASDAAARRGAGADHRWRDRGAEPGRSSCSVTSARAMR